MNRFVIVGGLPYLLAHGKTYSVRWDEKGFTVGAEVELASVPARTFSALSVQAKCAGHLDSISAPGATQEQAEHEDLDAMSVKELKAYAEEHGIDLNGLTKKADILKVMKAVIA
jgi:hypothetical protein